MRIIEPMSDHRGLRGSLDIARQVTQVLADLETEHLAEHPQPAVPDAVVTPLEGVPS